ncbi:MAG: NUDIX domain-containing protein [Candidatus Saccharimonas sp.]
MSDSNMKLIASLDQHDLSIYDDADRDISWTRRAARAVLTNEHGEIAVMHFTKTGSYKLPGGGIDDGEEIVNALHREILEETGYKITDIQKLGIVEEDRYFCGMHQTSYCFAATAAEFVGARLTKKEEAEGMNLRWANDIDEAISWIESGEYMDEDGSKAGLSMMKLRDIAILKSSQQAR